MEVLTFLAEAVRDHKVGALVPTSATCVREICKEIDTSRPVVVVEYGPGTGVFTRQLLDTLHRDSLIIAIELNQEFARRLRGQIGRRSSGPRLSIVNDTAANVRKILERHGKKRADYVLSGIPFSFMTPEDKREVIKLTHEALGPRGQFLVYQYSTHVRPFLKEKFPDIKVRPILWNLPPMIVMSARKTSSAKTSSSANRRVPFSLRRSLEWARNKGRIAKPRSRTTAGR